MQIAPNVVQKIEISVIKCSLVGHAGGMGGGGEGATADRRAVDLDALSFGQGGHLMSNRRCDLPTGSFRSTPKVGPESSPGQQKLAEADNNGSKYPTQSSIWTDIVPASCCSVGEPAAL